jgi:hypothetical protein
MSKKEQLYSLKTIQVGKLYMRIDDGVPHLTLFTEDFTESIGGTYLENDVYLEKEVPFLVTNKKPMTNGPKLMVDGDLCYQILYKDIVGYIYALSTDTEEYNQKIFREL